MAEQAPGSEVVASPLAEVLLIHVLRAHIAPGPKRKKDGFERFLILRGVLP